MSANAPLPDTWGKALAAFENDLFRRERSEKTVTTYGSCLQNFALFYRFLTVVQNAIVLWNVLSLEEVLYKTDDISSADFNRILPTMTRHINFVGRFDLDFKRQPPFELKQIIE